MRRVPGGTAIRPGIAGVEVAGTLHVDLSPARHRVKLGDQAAYWDVNEGRVAKIFEAVGKGDLQGLSEQMDGGGGAKTQFGQVKFFQDVEDLDEVHAAGTRRANRDDFMPAITAAHCFPALDLILL